MPGAGSEEGVWDFIKNKKAINPIDSLEKQNILI